MYTHRLASLSLIVSATLYLSSCGNEEGVMNSATADNTKTEQFVKVRLNLNGGSTRGNDGGFANGTAKESYIKNLTLAFYDTDGSYISANTLTAEEISSDLTVVSTKTDRQPARLIAFANMADAAYLFKGLSIAEALGKVLEGGSAITADSCFLMTSSTYLKNGAIEYGSPIEASNLSKDYEQASQIAAVDVFLERLAAKVAIDKGGNIPVTLPNYRNESLSFELQGIALNGTNKEAYYIKNISNYGFTLDDWTSAWNVADLHRCYWATDPNYTEAAANINAYQYNSYEQIVSNRALVEYCLENTTGDAQPLQSNVTHILIVGQYSVDNLPTGTDLYLYNAKLMTAQSYINLACSKHVFYARHADGTYSALEPSSYDIVRCGEMGNRAASVKLQLDVDASTELYRCTGGAYTSLSIADANDELANADNAVKYADGKCYYAVPIQHLGRSGKTGAYGVVRNHMYQVSVASIHNLGNGVWDPDEPIVPEEQEGDKDYYVGLKVQVLDWHIVAQEIDL